MIISWNNIEAETTSKIFFADRQHAPFGLDVKALRPLRGRALPEPGHRHRTRRAQHPAEKIEKRRWGLTASLTVTTATDKQGSKLVRWAAIEAVQRIGAHTRLGAYRDGIAQRRGRNQAKVAAARELVECVFYGLRDHHIRRLAAWTPPPLPPSGRGP
jgi:hypothetical protein